MKKTKQQRRIEVLKDAVKQINAQKLKAVTGTVVDLPYSMVENIDDTQLQPLLKEFFKNKENKGTCYCCARGALLISTVHKENDFILGQVEECSGAFEENSVIDKRLSRLFSNRQLAMMENAFECEYAGFDSLEEVNEMFYSKDDYYGINYGIIPDKLARKCVDFGKKYNDNNKRLLAIFKNAIRNNGIFTP